MKRMCLALVCSSMLLPFGTTQAAMFTADVAADSTSNPSATANRGESVALDAGALGTNFARFATYFQWNLPGDLAGATINSASMSFPLRNVTATSTGNYGLQAYTQQWTEGTAGNNDGVTYTTYDGVNPWPISSTNGGFSNRVNTGIVNDNINFDTQLIPVTPFISESTPAGFAIFDAKSVVEYWAAGNLNAGVAVQVEAGATSAPISIFAREGAAGAASLTIDYTPVPEPASLSLLGLAGSLLVVRRRHSM